MSSATQTAEGVVALFNASDDPNRFDRGGLVSVGPHAAVTSQLRIPSLTPSHDILQVSDRAIWHYRTSTA
jgi:hypothetical protein